MIGLGLGLALGAGLFCIWWSWWAPDADRPKVRSPRSSRLADELRQAGVEGVGPRGLLLSSVAVGVAVLAVAVAATGVIAIGGCFATMAAAAPVLWVRSRARRRRASLRDLWPDAVDNLASAVRAGLSLP